MIKDLILNAHAENISHDSLREREINLVFGGLDVLHYWDVGHV